VWEGNKGELTEGESAPGEVEGDVEEREGRRGVTEKEATCDVDGCRNGGER
jgi:hypothetical protein